MPVIIDCKTCGRKLRVPDDLAGQLVKCPTCGYTFESAGSRPGEPQEPARLPARTAVPERPSSIPKTHVPDPAERPTRAGGGFGFVQVSESKADPPAPGRRPPAPLPDGRDSGRAPPRRATERCPACGDFVDEFASRCRRCGEWLDGAPPGSWGGRTVEDRRDVEPHRGGLVLFLGILGLVLGLTFFLIPVAWIPGLAAWIMGQKDLAKIHRGLVESSGFGTTQAGWICGIIATCLWGLPTVACLGWGALTLVAR
jgi:hypothetical protein